MYSPLLDTFIAVAEDGSFTKASERLFLSPTAVMKQINTLEKQLDVKLLRRPTTGAVLTPAGEVVLRDAKFMIDYAKKNDRRGKSGGEPLRHDLLRRHLASESRKAVYGHLVSCKRKISRLQAASCSL